MSDKTAIVRGVLAAWAGRLSILFVTFFATPVLFGGLGEMDYGIWSVLISLTGYYGLIHMGLGHAGVKYLAELDRVADPARVRSLMSTLFGVYGLMAMGIFVIGGVVAVLFPALVGVGSHSPAYLQTLVLLTVAKVAVELLATTFRSSIASAQRYDLLNSVASINGLLVTLSCVGIVLAGGGLLEMAIVYFSISLMTDLLYVYLSIVRLGFPFPRLSEFDRSRVGPLFSFGGFTVVTQSAAKVSRTGGTILLAAMSGPGAAAFYAVIEGLIDKALQFGRGISDPMTALSSRSASQDDKAQLRKSVVVPTRLLLGLGATVAVTLIAFGHGFLSAWMSPDFARRSYPLLVPLAISLVLRLPTASLRSVLTGVGRVRLTSNIFVVEGLIVLIVGGTLAAQVGPIGLAYTVMVATALSGLLLLLSATRLTGLSFFEASTQLVVPCLFAVIPVMVVAVGLHWAMPAGMMLSVLVKMAATLFVGGVGVFVCCLDAPDRAAILESMPFGRRLLRVARERA